MYIHTGEREERVFDLIDKKKKVGFQSRILGEGKKERPRISTMRRCRRTR